MNFVYNIDTKGGEFFLGAGPAIGWGLGGKVKASGESSDIHFGTSADDQFKALELSANLLGGYKFNNGFFVSANYNPGLSDISNAEITDVAFHNHGFAIRIGMMLHGKTMKKSTGSQ